METKSILTVAATVAAFALGVPAAPDARAAYSSFTTQSTATAFHDPAASGNLLAVTTLNGYYMGQPMNIARIEVQTGGPVVKRGDPVPAGTFTDFGPARVSGSPPMFPPVGSGVPSDFNNSGGVDAADYVLWRNAAPQPLWNDPTFGVQPADYDAWRAHFGNAFNPEDTTTVAFSGSYDNPSGNAIFTKRGSQITTIAKPGDLMPSSTSPIESVGGDVAISGFNVAFGVALADGTGGILTGSGGPLNTIAKTGDTTSAGPLASFISAPAISGNTVMFAAKVGDGTTKGIFSGSGGELTTVFKTGDPAPVGVFTDLDTALSMGTSKVAFLASYDGGSKTGIFTGDGDELTSVVKVGDDVPGLGTINSLSAPSMSGNEVAFYATWSGGEGFLSRNGAEPVQLIASKAQLFPNYSPFYGPHGINMGRFGFSGNVLAFRFYMAVHAGNSIGIIGIHSPEPATLAMLGLALVAVAGCTRRRRSNQTPPAVRARGGKVGALGRQIAIAWCGVGLVCVATAIPAAAADLIHASAYLGETGVTGPYFQSGLSDSLYLGSRFSVDRAVEVESVGGHLEGLEGDLFAAIVPLSSSIALPTGSPFDSSTVATTVFTAPTPSDDILVPLSATLNPGHYALIFGSGQFGAAGSAYGGMPTNNVDFPGRSSYFQWQYNEWQAYTGSGLRFVIMGTVVGGPGPEPLYQSSLLQPTGFEDSSLADNSEAGQVGVGFVTRGPFNRRALLWKGTAESAINLHPSGFQYSEAYAIDGTSQVGVAYNDQYADDSHAMLWHGTAQNAIDLHPPGFRASRATGVLGSTQFGVGRLQDPLPFGYATHALLWHGSAESVVDLHPTGFDSSTLTDITETSQVGYGSRANVEHALLWYGTAESIVDLHPAGFERSRANAISENIQVGIGDVLGGAPRHALLWQGTAESVVDLHPAGFTSSSADFVSGDLQIGSGQPTEGGAHALLWRGSAESVINLTPSGYDGSQVNDVSGNYQVGWAANQGPTHAMVWNGTAESAIDLHDFLPVQPGAISSVATSIAANGDIVGFLTYRAGETHYYSPVLWKLALQPVPGDYDENGTVDAADYVLWRNTLGDSGTGLSADGNGNGEIDAGDYDLWRANFGQTAANTIEVTSTLGEAIPEPIGIVLLIAFAIVFAVSLRRRNFGTGLSLVIAIGFAIAPSIARAEYSFINVADTTTDAPSGTFTSFQPLVSSVYVDPPAISGTNVAFVAAYNNGDQSGVFRGSGGPLTTIAKTGDIAPQNEFREFNSPAIRGDTVAFQGQHDNGRTGIFMGNGRLPTAIVTQGDPVPASGFGFGTSFYGVGYPAFNGSAVGFWANIYYSDVAGPYFGIFSGAGGPLTTVVLTENRPPALDTILPGAPAFSNGTVAYATSNGRVFTGSGATTTTIAQPGDLTASGLTYLNRLQGKPVAISGDTVVFWGFFLDPNKPDSDDTAIFAGSGGPLDVIVKRGDAAPIGTFDGFGQSYSPSISGATVAFTAFFGDYQYTGIFTSTDGLLATVVKSGDPLFGSTVTDLTMGRFGLDPGGSGNLAFTYKLADGREGIAMAVPAFAALPGDYDGNGVVDASDYVVWRSSLGNLGSGLAADGNGNEVIDSGDYDVWRAHFGQTAATTITASSPLLEEIPEPTGVALLIVALLALLCFRGKCVLNGCTVMLMAAVVIQAPSTVVGASYSFINVADTTMAAPSGTYSDFLSNDYDPPAISGTNVAFIANYDGDTRSGMFRGGGGPLTTIAISGDVALGGAGAFHEPAIHGEMVAFGIGYDPYWPRDIFMGNGGALTKIVKSGDPPPGVSGYPYFIRFDSPGFNGDAIGFWGEFYAHGNYDNGIFEGTGGPLKTVNSDGYEFISAPAFSNGTVAFEGQDSSLLVFRRSGDTTTTIYRYGDPISGIPMYRRPGGVTRLSISGDTVVFAGQNDKGGLDYIEGIVAGDGGMPTLIAKTGDPAPTGTFRYFLRDSWSGENPSISGDTIVFSASYGEPAHPAENGIFTSRNGVLATVIKSGDPLFDSTITDVMTGRFAIDPEGSGNLAFTYKLADGREGVALARASLTSIPGDYDGNGVVDACDYVVWRNTLGEIGSGLPADGNGNGQVDPADYDVWRANFGQSTAAEGIPEPATIAMSGLALIALLGGALRRKQRVARKTMTISAARTNAV